ncbi:splicing regulator RBM11 isoform X1 [Theropithecus gelada]|uniref:splicing regulator RBM11 isoform X1 n=1 Tax=Theropithecus gelada TaxID=9565 RepID=UPI000DC1BD31|nr:splicing regulator RBM11 isoform X1 [Theropithecus gelada]
MFPAQEEADRTVFVGNLEARVREEILYELFLQAGPLTKVTICKDREGKPKSFGFVCFKHPESVSYAIALLNGIRLYGRPINVQYRFGSSHSSEPANQSFESCVKINSYSYRNEEMVVGRSSFPMQCLPIHNTSLPQEYFPFQKMVNECLLFSQQWHAYNPVLQLPYYEMTAPLPNSASVSSSLNHVPDLEAGPSSYKWTHQQPSDSDLYQMTAPLPSSASVSSSLNHVPDLEARPTSYKWTHQQPSDSDFYQMNKRKRQKQTSDSDSSTDNNRGNECSQKFRKSKKKKRY